MADEASEAALIWSPFGSVQEAREVADVLLQENLVACANFLPQMTSVFRYEGQVQSANEVGVLFKTHGRLLDTATTRLAELHPYNTPAICGWMADSAPPATRDWIAGLLGGNRS
ncbi:divalent-cation tolerance protein CutA [Aurantiacibacter odishensis]|uniref:divalent-cation tolerance protein CutA n=1 Tax=Aurantiacibacter odishensis TaxID=1155476 RepID=UPI000E723AB0|nr:divalent-cation tolerance protein CutA [Aurantiacibacter odishensis]